MLPSDDGTSRVPSILSHLVEEVRPQEAEICPWSLSGPQYPPPTAIQQRYCYPQGNPEYSSRTGGALFTMYGRDGKENLEFRVLHVYRSAKRAGNQGVTVEDDVVQGNLQHNKAKWKKRPRTDPPEDLVVDNNISTIAVSRNIPAAKSDRNSHSSTKQARETFSAWQQHPERPTRSPKNMEAPVAILSPRLPITSVPTKWRSLAIRILECSEGAGADQSCYNEVLSFLKEQKGHRIIPEQQGRCSNGKERQLNEALDVLWASLASSDSGGDASQALEMDKDGAPATTNEGGKKDAKQKGHRQSSSMATTALPIASISASTPSLSLRTRKVQPLTKQILRTQQQSPEKKPLRRRQELLKHPGKTKDSYESDEGSLVF